jgi:hypothetical protein
MSAMVAIFLVVILFRIFMRRRPRRVVTPHVIVVVQQPAMPSAPLTLEQELERIAGAR